MKETSKTKYDNMYKSIKESELFLIAGSDPDINHQDENL